MKFSQDHLAVYYLLAQACPMDAVKAAMLRRVNGRIDGAVVKQLRRQAGYGMRVERRTMATARTLRSLGLTCVYL